MDRIANFFRIKKEAIEKNRVIYYSKIKNKNIKYK